MPLYYVTLIPTLKIVNELKSAILIIIALIREQIIII
jgi:hypothetical protein